jgi:uncharacterized membrane protein
VIVPARRFGDYLAVMCGLIRRYGASEPTVVQALLRLLSTTLAATDDRERWTTIEEQAQLLVTDAERDVAQSADLTPIHVEADNLRRLLVTRRADADESPTSPERQRTTLPPT